MVRLVLAGSDVVDLRNAQDVLSSKGIAVSVVERQSEVIEIVEERTVPGVVTVIIAQQVSSAMLPTVRQLATRLGQAMPLARGSCACFRINFTLLLAVTMPASSYLHADCFCGLPNPNSTHCTGRRPPCRRRCGGCSGPLG
jgi:hypothetical protein